MIWLILLFKLSIALLLLRKFFYYSGSFLFIHTICDTFNKVYSNNLLAMLTFLIIPHLLIGFIAETYKSKLLRISNILSISFLLVNLFIQPFAINIIINYFFAYNIAVLIILNKSLFIFNKESGPLIGALVTQIVEIAVYLSVGNNYTVVNILNCVYYVGLVVYLFTYSLWGPKITSDMSKSISIPKEMIKIKEDEIREIKVA
jgi:hypothetical protein